MALLQVPFFFILSAQSPSPHFQNKKCIRSKLIHISINAKGCIILKNTLLRPIIKNNKKLF